MSLSSFRSLFMVASCAGAALGCYLVSLRVASERAALEEVETRIVLDQRDLRTLQTEIGTRGRLAQLERWNVKVLALSAPSADQFLSGSFELAKLAQPGPRQNLEAPVVLASAPKPTASPLAKADDDGDLTATTPAPPARASATAQLMHQASLDIVPPPEPPVRMPARKHLAAAAQKPAPAPATKTKAPKTAAIKSAKPAKFAKPIKLAAADPPAPRGTKPLAKAKAAARIKAKVSTRTP